MTTTNRTGLIQKLQNRGYKRSNQLSFWKHLAFIWGGGIILWPTLTALLAYSTMPNSEALVLTFIVAAVNIFTGWLPALMIFLLNWGIRGWIDTANDFRTKRARLQHEAWAERGDDIYRADLPAAPGAETTLTEDEIMAQWKAMNPYGCCMDHRDAQGYPSHGGPDCEHPELY